METVCSIERWRKLLGGDLHASRRLTEASGVTVEHRSRVVAVDSKPRVEQFLFRLAGPERQRDADELLSAPHAAAAQTQRAARHRLAGDRARNRPSETRGSFRRNRTSREVDGLETGIRARARVRRRGANLVVCRPQVREKLGRLDRDPVEQYPHWINYSVRLNACSTGWSAGTLASPCCFANQLGRPSSVVTDFVPIALSGVMHERVSTPSTSTEHDPHLRARTQTGGRASRVGSISAWRGRVGRRVDLVHLFVHRDLDGHAIPLGDLTFGRVMRWVCAGLMVVAQGPSSHKTNRGERSR